MLAFHLHDSVQQQYEHICMKLTDSSISKSMKTAFKLVFLSIVEYELSHSLIRIHVTVGYQQV